MDKIKLQYKATGGDFINAGTASSQVKKVLKQLGIDPQIIKRTVIALYEAEVNIVAHADEGIITAWVYEDKIILLLKDKGPGIANINKAMEAGYSTASEQVRSMGFGAGMGLPNIKKNADEFDIKSKVNVGTELKIVTVF
jgi:serine/threonine-protein kinase RsbT